MKNRKDLIASVKELMTHEGTDATQICDFIFAGILSSVMAEEKFTYKGFGAFKLSKRDARVARNPRTGEPVNVPAKTTFKFKLDKDAKAKLGV